MAPRRSRNEILDDFSGYVGQPEIAALKTVGQPSVVESEQVENRRVNVVNVHRFLDRLENELVGSAVNRPAFDGAACQPHREPEWIVVTAALDPATAATDPQEEPPGTRSGQRVLSGVP